MSVKNGPPLGGDKEDYNMEEQPIKLQNLDQHKRNTNEYNDTDPLMPRDDAEDTAESSEWYEEFEKTSRVIVLGQTAVPPGKKPFPSNRVRNNKYNALTFLPLCLYEQFKFFFNLYFLFVSLSQVVPALRIGYLSAYIVPLAFVLTITLSREAIDDIVRRRRDRSVNNLRYETLQRGVICSQDIRVGDILFLHKNSQVPADCLLLRNEHGEAFITTDQLDGETDWKLRLPCPVTQVLDATTLLNNDITFQVEKPRSSIYSFQALVKSSSSTKVLTLENTIWANTKLKTSDALALVIYTGSDCRQAMNTSKPKPKVGLLEREVNSLAKILCILTLLLSGILVLLHGPTARWFIDVLRFLILFSTIVPISLRVNLDLGKSKYAYDIEHDEDIEGAVVRSSSIPEDLGRIEHLLTDKTGTLTQNEMKMKKIHFGSVSYSSESFYELAGFLREEEVSTRGTRQNLRKTAFNALWALALCHNVTPVDYSDAQSSDEINYQASSPDEIAIVRWLASIGLTLIERDRVSMKLKFEDKIRKIEILKMFPFTSESKRMSVIVKFEDNEIYFIQKGADMVMSEFVAKSDWLDEECSNLAREGLRTLVFGRKRITDNYQAFKDAFDAASNNLALRESAQAEVISKFLENNLELLGITGVEDILQIDVKPTLELLRNADIKIWMLTGDKVETATCVATSSRLVRRGQNIVTVENMNSDETLRILSDMPSTSCLVIDGKSLSSVLIPTYRRKFINIAKSLNTVVACRCSPVQKADLTILLRQYTKKRVCCIGDGGNDVSMIQAADVGIGLSGKEGQQASLSSDFSIEQFCHLTTLLMWHGRNCYRNSSELVLMIIHRGLIIAVAQAGYSIASNFEPLALYDGWLMVGFATIYTMMPLFSIVLDYTVPKTLIRMYPELYTEQKRSKALGYLSFLLWVILATYQGIVALVLTLALVKLEATKSLILVSYTTLVITEWAVIAFEFSTWKRTMILVFIITILIFFGSMFLMPLYFDRQYILTLDYLWKTSLTTAICIVPPVVIRAIYLRLNPPNYTKLQSN